MKIKSATRHIKDLCKFLGDEYEVVIIDFEYVIYRNFGNGYEIEVSGANTNSKNKPVTIFLWCTAPMNVIGCINGVPHNDIAECIDFMYIFSEYYKDAAPKTQEKLLELFQREWTDIKQFYMNA